MYVITFDKTNFHSLVIYITIDSATYIFHGAKILRDVVFYTFPRLLP